MEKGHEKGASQSTDTNRPSATPEAEFAKAPSEKIARQEQDVKQKSSRANKTEEPTSDRLLTQTGRGDTVAGSSANNVAQQERNVKREHSREMETIGAFH